MNARASWSATQALMDKGSECYPFSAANIQEAVQQADYSELERLEAACDVGDWNEAGFAVRELALRYWERQAQAVVRQKQLARVG